MPKILKYEFESKKVAVINNPRGTILIGELDEYYDINGKVKVSIRLDDKLPKELVDMLVDVAQGISIVGNPSNIHNIKLIDQPVYKKVYETKQDA